METRANYILIGAFTVAGLLGMLGFFLLFASVELDRQFDYYDVRFSSVSGLNNASDVRFSGLPVGQVVDVRLAPERDGTILVRLEVDAETPVRADSVATIEAQGVTGVSYVGINGGTPEAPLLEDTAVGDIPEIQSGRSVLQALSEDAPALFDEALMIVSEIGDLLTDENSNLLKSILVNTEAASAEFASSLENFSAVADTVNTFADEISRFNSTLNTITEDLTTVLSTTNTTIEGIGLLTGETRLLVARGAGTLDGFDATMAETQRFVAEDLVQTADDARALMDELRAQAASLGADAEVLIGSLSTDAGTLIATLDGTGQTATARLDELAQTLAGIDALVAQLDTTATDVATAVRRIDGLVASDGAPLLTESRALIASANATMASINVVATVDLPAIVADIRSATQTTSRVISEVGGSLTSATGEMDGLVDIAETALTEATTIFRNANGTISAINTALETGDRTLEAATEVFTSADRVLDNELTGIITMMESTLGALTQAVNDISADLPAVTGDLRAASESAAAAFAAVEEVAERAGPDIATFTSTALPLYSRLATEARILIENLDQLTQQIERDPARFFLDQGRPDFRR